MLLAADIGNTTVAVAGLERDGVAFVKKLPSDPALDWPAALRELLAGEALSRLEGAVLSSVVPALTGAVGEGLEALTGAPVLVVDKSTDTGLDLSGYNTANLGMDRVVDCVAALALCGGPAAVFDLGTATTLSVVDGEGAFRGGMILAGVALGLEALSARAAQLPSVSLAPPAGLLGTDTASCMQYGALYGAAGAIEGIVRRLEGELGRLTVVLTGGNGPYVAPLLSIPVHLEPHLTFLGLRELWRRSHFN